MSSFLAAAGLLDDDEDTAPQPPAAPRRPRSAPSAPPTAGPVRRQPVRPVRPAPPVAERQNQTGTGFLVAAAHGGAGASTVAALLEVALGPGIAAEPKAPAAVLATRRRTLLVVARANAYGLMQASARLPEVAHHRPVLVLVADAPAGDPVAVRFRVRALDPLVSGVVRVPFLPWLRAADHASDLADFPKLRRAASALARELSHITPVEGA